MAKNDLTTIPSEEDAFDMAVFEGVDVSSFSGAGNENVSSSDIAIPYLNILQKMSPQCDEDSPEFVPDAKPGMFYQNVNKIMWPRDSILAIVPVAFTRMVVEWVPREKGGGLVAVHDLDIFNHVQHQPNDKKIPVRVDNGNLLIDTAQHIVLYKSLLSGEFEPALISMKSTNLKKSRLWNSLISQQMIPGTKQQAPRWMFEWNTTTIREEKDGNSWYNFEFARGRVVDKETFLKAAKLHDSSRRGTIRGNETGNEPTGDIPF